MRASKVCARNRKSIALLAAGTLQAQAARELRHHIDNCEGCCRYWNELSEFTSRLSNVMMEADVEPSPTFHARLMARLRRESSAPGWRNVVDGMQGVVRNWRWRLATCALGLAALLATVWFLSGRHSASQPGTVASSRAAIASQVRSEAFSPSLANYEAAANHSLDELDGLLARQANCAKRSLPMYRASPFSALASSE